MGENAVGLATLSDAIRSLRSELARAWTVGEGEQVRFRPSPVELTLQVGLTSTGKGSAGVKWWVLSAGGEVSRETAVTQTVRLTLDPVLLDESGQQVEFLIEDVDSSLEVEGKPGCEALLDDRE